eukprot:3076977-Rhodomonas_salina.2
MSAGYPSALPSPQALATPFQLEPESNQTSMVSRPRSHLSACAGQAARGPLSGAVSADRSKTKHEGSAQADCAGGQASPETAREKRGKRRRDATEATTPQQG